MNGDIGTDVIDIRRPTRRIKVIDINPNLMCVLCGGYYVDATTIIECLHSFCKSCIVRYLDTSKFCPICDVQIHKTKPLLNIRSDQTLQDIVYKLVPGLFQREMKRRREFYAKQPPEALKNLLPKSNEERGEVDYAFPHNIFSPDEFISVALEYSSTGVLSEIPNGNGHVDHSSEKSTKAVWKRYLRCPVVITVAHIKKLIRAKCGVSEEQRVDLMFSRDCLNEEFMIMDIAYMYAWKRKGPLKLYFRIFDQPNKRLKTVHHPVLSTANLMAVKLSKRDVIVKMDPSSETVEEKTTDSSTRIPDDDQKSLQESTVVEATIPEEKNHLEICRIDDKFINTKLDENVLPETNEEIIKLKSGNEKDEIEVETSKQDNFKVAPILTECKISLEKVMVAADCDGDRDETRTEKSPLLEKINGITMTATTTIVKDNSDDNNGQEIEST